MFIDNKIALIVVIVCAVSVGGCVQDNGPERVVVMGTATFNGVPLPDGIIRFLPKASTSAPISAAQIQNGQYKADVHGGVPVGDHRIVIEAYREQPVSGSVDASLPPGEGSSVRQYLPAKYNTHSELELTVTPSHVAFVKNFDLTD